MSLLTLRDLKKVYTDEERSIDDHIKKAPIQRRDEDLPSLNRPPREDHVYDIPGLTLEPMGKPSM